MQNTIQGLLGALPFLGPEEKFYLASFYDKIGHSVGDAIGMPPGVGTLNEGLLSERGKQELDAVARYVLGQGRDSIAYRDYFDAGQQNDVFNSDLNPGRFEKTLGKADVSEDDNYIYIKDKYDFDPAYGTLEEKGGVTGVLSQLARYIGGEPFYNDRLGSRSGLLGAATILAPLVSYSEKDTRAPRVNLKIPKKTPGVKYKRKKSKE